MVSYLYSFSPFIGINKTTKYLSHNKVYKHKE